MSSETIDYYNKHANDFALATNQIDMATLYAEFLPLIKAGGHILDAGCGSGRDAAFFKQQGFIISAFDASAEMAHIASARLQQAVAVQHFEQLNELKKFDGIWCCASLLHVASGNLPAVFSRLQRALNPGAVLYASFKYGDGERFKDGRMFTDMNESKLAELTVSNTKLALTKTWLTQDTRPERRHEIWLNALLIKDGK